MSSDSHKKKSIKKLLLKVFLIIFIFIFLPLCIVELFLRIFHPIEHLKPIKIPPGESWHNMIHKPSSVPGLDYELNPNAKKEFNGVMYRINSYGMRDDEPLSKTDKQKIHRIAVLGDSFAMGYHEDQNFIFPVILEKMLNASTTNTLEKFDVLNFGVDGYSTRQEASVLKYKAIEFKPDVVILAYVLNDPENDPVIPEVSRVYHKTYWWQHFHMLRSLYVAKVQWQMNKYGKGDYLRYLHNKNFYKWKSIPESFNEIKKIANENNIKVILMISPVIVENSWDEYPYKDLHEQVSDEAKKYGFFVIDSLDAMKKISPGSRLWTTPEDRHPNKIGHYLLAEKLKNEILSNHDMFFKE